MLLESLVFGNIFILYDIFHSGEFSNLKISRVVHCGRQTKADVPRPLSPCPEIEVKFQ